MLDNGHRCPGATATRRLQRACRVRPPGASSDGSASCSGGEAPDRARSGRGRDTPAAASDRVAARRCHALMTPSLSRSHDRRRLRVSAVTSTRVGSRRRSPKARRARHGPGRRYPGPGMLRCCTAVAVPDTLYVFMTPGLAGEAGRQRPRQQPRWNEAHAEQNERTTGVSTSEGHREAGASGARFGRRLSPGPGRSVHRSPAQGASWRGPQGDRGHQGCPRSRREVSCQRRITPVVQAPHPACACSLRRRITGAFAIVGR